MSSIVVSKSIFILNIIEEYIFLRFIAHNTKKSRFSFHPVKIFDQSIMCERINKFKSIRTDIKDINLFRNS